MRFLRKLAASVALIAQLVSAGNAIAQAMPATVFNPTSQPNGGWSYDPSTQGMRDLREMKPIEGCNAPGGLTRITDRDAGDSAPFWCGPPPHCLAEGTNGVDACKFIPYCRNEPRGDPNGIPGANGCRDPEDLLCVSSGAHPEGGQCLKTCWDGSRILFSQACPPQCSTDALGNTTCVYDSPPSAPPQTPAPPSLPTPPKPPAPPTLPTTPPTPPSPPALPTPPTTPTPPKLSCPAGSTPYQSCNFVWGSVAHNGTASVASNNGVSGTLSATCNDGAWVNVVASCTPAAPPPTVCPDGKVVPAGQACPIVPNPTQICPDGITEMPLSGICPQPTKTCPDSSVVPLSQPCPALPPPTKICADGSVVLATDTCPTLPPPTQICPDGSVIPASAACWTPPPAAATKTCLDGSVIPASATCSTPTPIAATCVPITIGCGSITVSGAEAAAAAAGATCYSITATSGYQLVPGYCIQYPEDSGPTCYESSYISLGACVGG